MIHNVAFYYMVKKVDGQVMGGDLTPTNPLLNTSQSVVSR